MSYFNRFDNREENLKKITFEIIASFIAFISLIFAIYSYINNHHSSSKNLTHDGDNYYAKEEYEDALYTYEKAIDLDPKNLDAHIGKSKVFCHHPIYTNQNCKKALEICDEIIKINSKYAEIYYTKGDFYFELKDYDKAIENYDKAIEFNYENKEWVYHGKGLIYTYGFVA